MGSWTSRHKRKSLLAIAARHVPTAIATGMLLYRFANLDLAPFIQDEPEMLASARAHLLEGSWATASPLIGSLSINYGPSTIWFYILVQRVFGSSAQTCIAAMCVLVTATHFILAVALTRLFKGGPYFLAAMIAFIASSPYQFYWSRLAWDQMVNATSAVAIVMLCAERPWSIFRSVGLGLVLGIALSSHPMVVPLVIVIGLVLFFEFVRKPKELAKTLLPAGAAMLAVNVPYLVYLSRTPLPTIPHGAFRWPRWETLMEIPRVASPWGIDYFLQGDWSEYQSWTNAPPGLYSNLALFAYVILALTITGLVATLVYERGGRRRIAIVALAAMIVYPFFLTKVERYLEPHYQFPVWWVAAVGLAGTLALANHQPKAIRAATFGTVSVVALAQFCFIVAWMGFIRDTGGTRDDHYYTPVGAQVAAIRTLCRSPEQNLYLINTTPLNLSSLQYLAHTEKGCKGREVVLCQSTCDPPPPPDATVHRLSYAASTGGKIVVR